MMRLFIDFFCCALVGLALSLHAYVRESGSSLEVGVTATLCTMGAFVLRRRLMKRLETFQEKRKNERATASLGDPGPDMLPEPGIYRHYKLEAVSAPGPG